MWVPPRYRGREASWPAAVIDAHPFALLVNTEQGVPLATHIPIVVEPEDRERADAGLEGVRILGHLARANDQWRVADPGVDALLVVAGPNAYVSPAVYRDLPAAPTWNYVSVHVRGPLRWLHDADDLMRIIDLTIDRTEANEGTGWDREPSREFHERILRGIVAFELVVRRCDSTFKLSQDQPAHRRDAVIDRQGATGQDELVRWTRRAGPDAFTD